MKPLPSSFEKYSFSGHESFPIRYAWLKKGYDAVKVDPQVFSRKEATVHLGVGKNMVISMRHWCLAAGILEEDPDILNNRGRYLKPTNLGLLLLGSDGFDPYLEDRGTPWLLHWLIVTNRYRATTWTYAFGHLNRSEFTKDDLISDIILAVRRDNGAKISENTLKRDVDVFIRTYAPSKKSRAFVFEDTLDCPLVELSLIREMGLRSHYMFQRGPKPTLPDFVFTYALCGFWNKSFPNVNTLSFNDVAYHPDSPGQMFKLDGDSLAFRLEKLQDLTEGQLRLDETAGLRQILRVGPIDPESFLHKYFGIFPEASSETERYKKHIQQLDSKTGGVLTCGKGEDVKTVRVNLRRAAKELGKKLTIKTSGNQLSYYLKE